MKLKKIAPLLFVGMLTLFAQAARAQEAPSFDQGISDTEMLTAMSWDEFPFRF
jgi:hypothetical protein